MKKVGEIFGNVKYFPYICSVKQIKHYNYGNIEI